MPAPTYSVFPTRIVVLACTHRVQQCNTCAEPHSGIVSKLAELPHERSINIYIVACATPKMNHVPFESYQLCNIVQTQRGWPVLSSTTVECEQGAKTSHRNPHNSSPDSEKYSASSMIHNPTRLRDGDGGWFEQHTLCT